MVALSLSRSLALSLSRSLALSFASVAILALPTVAVAAPAIGTSVCTVQQVTIGDAAPVWQIKGTTSVTGLPAGTKSVSVTITFEKCPKATGVWGTISTVTQTTNAVNGTATIDTGFQNLAVAPVAGDRYRIGVAASYTDANNMVHVLVPIGSLEITPIP